MCARASACVCACLCCIREILCSGKCNEHYKFRDGYFKNNVERSSLVPDDGEDKEQRIDLERLSVKPDSITIQLTVELRLREECSLRRGPVVC